MWLPSKYSSHIVCPCVFLRGPRCVARFDFDGEQSDELSFSEGDMIWLKEYVGEEWARGEVNGHVGIFPLNYVDVLEDLPPATVQKPAQNNNKFALPGKTANNINNAHFIECFNILNTQAHTFMLYNTVNPNDGILKFPELCHSSFMHS